MDSKKKSLRLNSPEDMEYITQTIEEPRKGEVLLKVKKLGLCGSDLHAYKGRQAIFEYPRIMGHEICAYVEKTAEGSNLNKGDMVTLLPYLPCHECVACRNGKENCCENLKVLGIHVDGALTEYFLVPEEQVMKVEGIHEDDCALIEPLAISAHAVRRARPEKGENVLVIGLGTIGLGVANILKYERVNVLGLDLNANRVKYAEDKIGIDAMNVKTEDLDGKIRGYFKGEMPTIVFDATGNSQSMKSTVKYLSHGGSIVFIGFHKGELGIDDLELHKREVTIYRSRAANVEDFKYVEKMMSDSKVPPRDFMITRRVGFDDLKDEFDDIGNDESMIKCLVEF